MSTGEKMIEIECTTTSEAEDAITAGNVPVLIGSVFLSVSVNCKIVCRDGAPHVVARESSQPHVVAWGSSRPHVEARESSQPHVEAWGSSQPHVEAWGSSQPRVVAWGSSQPHVVARESSQPHVEATGSCQVSVRGRVQVKATQLVAVLAFGALPIIDGGGFVNRVDNSTPAAWCEYYGVEVDPVGVATLYKAVRDNFHTKAFPFAYVPGTCPEALDWDGGTQECGGGLHFSPTPKHALEFDGHATKFVACPVRLDELSVHPDGSYPQKVKGKRVCSPCWEVDIDGKRIEQPAAES